VAKRKNTLALFEVISRSKEHRSQAGLDVPSWMGEERGEQQPPERPSPPQPEPPKQAGAKPAARTPEPTQEPMVSTSGGRLRVSLNYSGAIVLGVAVVLLLGAAFAIGRATAGGGGDTKPAVTAGAGDGAGPGEAEVGPGAGAAQRVPGKHYLVIRDFDPGSDLEQEAGRIAAFCTAQGEPAEVRTLTDRHTREPFIAVWSLKGFDEPNSQAAQNYRRRIQALGEQYYSQHETFRFNPWYAPYNPEP
jgi:hypothetical protein